MEKDQHYQHNAAPLPPPPPSLEQHQQQFINRQFPPAFSVYRSSAFSRSMMLGEHQDQPLYAISLHSGWSGQPDVVLHAGLDDGAPPLACVETRAFQRSGTIILPPLGAGLGAGAPAVAEEPLRREGDIGPGRHTFAVEVGPAMRRETFQWRHSRGREVGALGGRGSGWKLLRLEAAAPAGVHSSDGKEIVAVWAGTSMSMTKALNFRFLGSGANGVLGERWAVMAVMSALRIWDKERKQRSSGAGAAATSGG